MSLYEGGPSSSTDPRAKRSSATCGRRRLDVEAIPTQASIAEMSIWTSRGHFTREMDISENTYNYPKSPTAMSVNREKWPWKATVMVSVGPLRCLATMRSASPARGESFS